MREVTPSPGSGILLGAVSRPRTWGDHTLQGCVSPLDGTLPSASCPRSLFFFFLIFIYLFIYGCVGSSFLCEGFL